MRKSKIIIAALCSLVFLCSALNFGGGEANAAPEMVDWAPSAQSKCSSDGSAITLAHPTIMDDGGVSYEYTIDGHRFEWRVPPKDFRPDTATADELARYGFPARPAEQRSLQAWNSVWDTYRGTVVPGLCMTNRYNLPAQAAVDQADADGLRNANSSGVSIDDLPEATLASGNWAGAISYADTSYVAVQGDWTQPAVHDCGCGTTDTDESSWAGLGGASNLGGKGNGGLLQEGTSMQGSGNMFAWYEYIAPCGTGSCGVPEIEISNFPIAAGMSVHTYTAFQTSNNQANFLVCANGLCVSIVGTVDSMYYDGSTAEQIDERPSYCATSCYKPLTNFDHNDWTNIQVETSDSVWLNELQDTRGDSLWMVNSDGYIMAAPTQITPPSMSMTETWIRAS